MNRTMQKANEEWKRSIAKWLDRHADEHRDVRTGEVNLTSLVEAWDNECSTGDATLDVNHPAWDLATEVV